MNIKVDSHTHTIASGHAYSTITENALSAYNAGLEAIGMSDHAPSLPGSPNELFFYNLHVVDKTIYGVRILKSIELNIMDGNGNVDSCINERIFSEMDYTIASYHPIVYPAGSRTENTRTYIRVMDNLHVNIIGHPEDERVPVYFDELAKAAKETNTILEINNSSLMKGSYRENSRDNYIKMLKACEKYNTLVTLGTDAHFNTLVGRFSESLNVITEAEFPEELIVSTSLDRFLKSISLK